MVEKKIANRLCCAAGVSQHLGHEEAVAGLTGTAGLSLALGSPCPLPELRGGSVSAHPLPSSLPWHTSSWSDVQCRCRDDCPELLME